VYMLLDKACKCNELIPGICVVEEFV